MRAERSFLLPFQISRPAAREVPESSGIQRCSIVIQRLRSRHLIITDDTESHEAQIAEKKGQQRED